jgi:rabenosyn-5
MLPSPSLSVSLRILLICPLYKDVYDCCRQTERSKTLTRVAFGIASVNNIVTVPTYLLVSLALIVYIQYNKHPNGMTSPGPQPAHSPQPRRFGSIAPTPPRSSNNTPRISTPTLVPPPAEPRRTRSSSSASVISQDGSDVNNNSFGKAQAWLSTWAPRGEGRTREFLAHTVNGVASVASTVSSGLGGTVNTLEQRAGLGSRPNSFHAVGQTSGQGLGIQGHGQGEQLRQVVSPPGPVHTASSPSLPLSQATTGRKPLMPANASRLAPSTPSNNHATSPPTSNGLHRPSLSLSNSPSSSPSLSAQPPPGHQRSNTSSSQTHAPHGPSHLNPKPRASFSHPAPNHVRSPSMSYVPSASPTPSRSSSTANGIWRSAGMPYKVGFQPAGVKHDRTAEFHNDRKRMAEEREKEEGRLGRRWAKVRLTHSLR